METRYTDIPIVARASEIIDYLGAVRNDKSAVELLKEFDLPKTTCYRLLHTLVKYEFLAKDETTGHYYLGKKFSDYSTNINHKFYLLSKSAHQYLEKLAVITQETAKLSVLSNGCCYVLDTVDGPRKIKIAVDVGTELPLHAGAASKILFMSIGERTKHRIFQRGLEQFTSKTITTEKRMRQEFEKISRLGYSVDVGEYAAGIGAVACPVLDYRGNIIAAVSVAYTILNTNPAIIETFIPLIKEATQEISKNFSEMCFDATI